LSPPLPPKKKFYLAIACNIAIVAVDGVQEVPICIVRFVMLLLDHQKNI
jgi:hypothetical protein